MAVGRNGSLYSATKAHRSSTPGSGTRPRAGLKSVSRIEAIGPYAGRPLDPLNQAGSLELLHRLQEVVPTVHLTYTKHFLATLFDYDRGKYAREAANGVRFTSTVFLAPKWPWRGSGFNIKTYFLPRMIGGTVNTKGLTLAQWEGSLKQIGPANEARQAMFDFLANDPEGQCILFPSKLSHRISSLESIINHISR
ncbi:hypothetical protein PENCOP_c012G06775 [Penicillium coprophilum]|uniref:Uncharacterized protein n=1 Tax=Penicillium coprophilum TaxID=36646 RepID=A0A1V6UC35_9EURO|nr:hypothetical protein PENCOP_c012G06775 [Penicillium coprophilum]